MSKTTLTNPKLQPKPGEFITVFEREVTAVPNRNCIGCIALITKRCNVYPDCRGVIFVTYDEYIKRRLKNEL